MTSPTASIAHVLRGIDFPCSRDSMLDYARRKNAEADEIDLLSVLPDRDYRSMAEVFHGLRVARGEADDGEIGVSPPPEPKDFYEEISNPPPLSVPVPDPRQEVLAPWLWPWEIAMTWVQSALRLQNLWWETHDKR